MNCNEELVDLKGMDDRSIARQLAFERNQALKSRQEWIQAAFNLKAGSSVMFDELVKTELCPNCVTNYNNDASKNS